MEGFQPGNTLNGEMIYGIWGTYCPIRAQPVDCEPKMPITNEGDELWMEILFERKCLLRVGPDLKGEQILWIQKELLKEEPLHE